MKKKYYFNSICQSMIYMIIVLFLLGLVLLCSFADDKHSGVIFIICFLSISVILLLYWIGFSLSMRIQVDYENEELYIRHPYFMKRLKFEEILSIEIADYSEVAFDFIITTKYGIEKLSYSRYYKKRPSPKVIAKVKELKKDLINISTNRLEQMVCGEKCRHES